MCVAPKSRFALGTWVIWSQECSWSMCWGGRGAWPTPVHQVVLAVRFFSISHSASRFPSPSVCLFPSLSVLPLSGGFCAAHKDVQHVSPSCTSGAMNCLITAATPLPEHPSSVKQNFLSVWSARLHFHICIFLLFFPPFLVSFLPALSHRGRSTHNAPLSGGGRQGDGAAATGFPWPCPQGEADSPSHYPWYGWQHHWSGQGNERGN